MAGSLSETLKTIAMHHVKDSNFFEVPAFLQGLVGADKFALPLVVLPIYGEFQVTKFMVLQSVAGLMTLFIFSGLARNIRNGRPATGLFWNFWEFIALYIRDNVVRPAISAPHHHSHDEHGHGDYGHADHTAEDQAADEHYADHYLPFIWSIFFYILFCNLLGAVPLLGSATADTGLTGALAVIALAMTIGVGIRHHGVGGYLTSFAPPIDAPPVMKVFLIPLIWVIEVVGVLIKHTVLAIRLFSNIFAGHLIIAIILAFIQAAADAGTGVWMIVTPLSIGGQIAVGLLELLVAFLQAYVFSILASKFIGMAINPH